MSRRLDLWLNPEIHEGIIIPKRLYPEFAPLPIPFAQHLVTQEYRKQRRIATRKYTLPEEPPPEYFWKEILGRVRQERAIVFENMHSRVVVDKRKQQQGGKSSFPDSEWMLEKLAYYTPNRGGKEFTPRVLENWVNRGLLTRSRERGPFDAMSAAAFLTTRLAEKVDEIKWLPPELAENEPRWWCYGQASPDSEVMAVPASFEHLPSSMILWTPWTGALWLDGWQMVGSVACRWASDVPSEQDIAIWNKEMMDQITHALHAIPFGRDAVYGTLLQEARKLLLERHKFPREVA